MIYANVHIINAAEANDLIAETALLILDVRKPEEYAEGHIQGAVNFPIDSIDEGTAKQVIGDFDTEILVYCASGTRSSIACGMLVELGYDSVYDMAGGLKDWPFGLVQ